jgi:hypothetical protein
MAYGPRKSKLEVALDGIGPMVRMLCEPATATSILA